MTNTVAVIGAGMAGLTTAEHLRRAGVTVTVFEKSRGLGGRMATRYKDGFSFDHGAQYISARSKSFMQEVQSWRAAGSADLWFDNNFVGVPSMSAAARELSQNLDVHLNQRICRLDYIETGWLLSSEQNMEVQADDAHYNKVVLAIPAPQALALTRTAGIDLPELLRPGYAPCLAMMVSFAKPLTSIPDRLTPKDPVIAWIARNSSKPGREPGKETFVVHATSEFSRTRLNYDRETIAEELLEAFCRLIGERPRPTLLMGHRWLYALVETALGKPCVWRPEFGLGACGDWCLGPRVESAYESGVAMAKQIVDSDY